MFQLSKRVSHMVSAPDNLALSTDVDSFDRYRLFFSNEALTDAAEKWLTPHCLGLKTDMADALFQTTFEDMWKNSGDLFDIYDPHAKRDVAAAVLTKQSRKMTGYEDCPQDKHYNYNWGEINAYADVPVRDPATFRLQDSKKMMKLRQEHDEMMAEATASHIKHYSL